MEYIYAAMIIHKAGHKVTEESVKKVLEAAGAKHDASKIKALVAALENVNIEEAIAKAAVAAPVAAPAAHAPAAAHGHKEEKKKEEKNDEAAAAGLGALFG